MKGSTYKYILVRLALIFLFIGGANFVDAEQLRTDGTSKFQSKEILDEREYESRLSGLGNADESQENGFFHYYPAYVNDPENLPFYLPYINHNYGYAFHKDGFFMDDSFEDIKTSFYTGYTFVDIFYEDFSGTQASAASYLAYSNKFFQNNEYVTIEQNRSFSYGGQKVRVIKWRRKPLKYVSYGEKDFPYYALIDIQKNFNEVYTIQINSHAPIEPFDYISRFRLIPKTQDAPLKHAAVKRKTNANWSKETKNFFEYRFKEIGNTELGIFEPTSAYYFEKLHAIEEKHELKFPYLLEYYSLSDTLYQHHFDELYKDGRILEFTFQTSFGNQLIPTTTYQILDGNYDQKITELANCLKNIKGPVFFRLNNEMNGDWCSYNALHFNRDSRLYVKMWEYFYRKIHEAGANNVIFVFNPNEKSFPNFKWNHYMCYFPGEDYVDVIGVTGYNTGNYYPGETWRNFSDIYDEFMPDYRARFLDYDFFITEFGSSTIGGDRIAWLDDMMAKINRYGFKVAIYWNGTDWDANGNPARIYKITDDNEAMRHFRDYMKKDYGNLFSHLKQLSPKFP